MSTTESARIQEPVHDWNNKCDIDFVDDHVLPNSTLHAARSAPEMLEAIEWAAREFHAYGITKRTAEKKISAIIVDVMKERGDKNRFVKPVDVATSIEMVFDKLAAQRTRPGLKSEMHDLPQASRDAMEKIPDDIPETKEVFQNSPKNPYKAAKDYREQQRPTLIHTNDDWLAWTGTYYEEIQDDTIKAELYAFLARSYKPNAGNVRNVADALKAVCHKPTGSFAPPCWLGNQPKHDDGSVIDPAEVLAFNDCLLHLPTKTKLAKTANFFNRNALSYGYHWKAPTPVKWLAFLKDVFKGSPGSVETLQEIFGYYLLPDNSLQKAFLWDSPPRGGKGTTIRVLQALIGPENCCSPSFSGIASDPILDTMVGKLAAFVTDMRITSRTDIGEVTGNIQRITGGDPITFNRKYKDAWTGFLKVRFFILTNMQLAAPDVSGAFANRFVCLKSLESWLGREDPTLDSKLLPELSGILLWAIEGWKRLKTRGRFLENEQGKAMLQRMIDASSPLMFFIRERCVYDPNASIVKEALFSDWLSFKDSEDLRDMSYPIFCRDLLATGHGVHDSKGRDGDVRVPLYKGIR